MTPTQKKVLDFIKTFIDKNGYSPSHQEIANAMSVTEPTARSHILSLIRRKQIAVIPGAARSIQIIQNV
tara:strand:+ start:2951 stop:3157 length:207 start_codon:yes stop_codon:yes gene_type:complete